MMDFLFLYLFLLPTKDTVQPSTENIQRPVVQTHVQIDEPVVAPKLNPTIPYPSRANKQKLYEKDDNLASKFVEIFRELHFELSFADALLHMPKFAIDGTLIDVYGEELTLRVDDEAITFKVGQTLRYSYNDAKSVNRINVIDVSCEEYAQEVLSFADRSTTCLTNDSIPLGIDDADFDLEGELLLLEKLLNDDPSSPLPPKELHFEEIKTIKSSIDDPPELELKDLPSHLEYAFLEGTDKLPVIISKELKDEEKAVLLKVLKSHKRAIAWKISNIKGIDPSFCTHKILMEDDFKLAVQHQRRVNPKIHEVIKKEVIKLLDAGLIYPISDSPWVSPVHCVPRKGGMTVVENEDNELIPTRLVTGWRVCIDYRKLNDATRKDHFPLPFMDQMLERLVGNEYYYKMLKRCEDTNLVLNWEKCHFMVKEGIVLGHKISKSGIEVDKEFDVIIRDKKGAKNLAADHLSRLENPYQSDLEKKEITETFALETLGIVTFHGDSSDVFTAKKPLISSRLAIMDPLGDIMVPTTSLKKSLMPVSFGLLFNEMPMTWSHGVTLVNVKDHSRLLEGTSIFSWPLITCQNGLKQKRSPLTILELL
ncbi:hypothetical protein Tco_0598853 [Tanacetum coccineum]